MFNMLRLLGIFLFLVTMFPPKSYATSEAACAIWICLPWVLCTFVQNYGLSILR